MNSIILFFQKLLGIFKASSQQLQTEHTSNLNTSTSVISYSEQLIPALKHDHQVLINLYGQISYYILSQKYDAIQQNLDTLKTEFNRHIMQENVSFYCYLEQKFIQNPEQLETIKFYRKEMNGISHAFIKFIKKWQTTAICDDNIEEFRTEYETIGQVLAQRINQEEDHLYTMYQPS